MERRVLLALFLSFLVFYAYQALMPAPPLPDANATVTPAEAAATPGVPAARDAAPSSAAAAAPPFPPRRRRRSPKRSSALTPSATCASRRTR